MKLLQNVCIASNELSQPFTSPLTRRSNPPKIVQAQGRHFLTKYTKISITFYLVNLTD